MFKIPHLLPLAALAAVLSYAEPSSAETIIDEWQSVKVPPAPQLNSVTLEKMRPRCVAAIPKI